MGIVVFGFGQTETHNYAQVNLVPGKTLGLEGCVMLGCVLAERGFCAGPLGDCVKISAPKGGSEAYPNGSCHLPGSLITLVGLLSNSQIGGFL